MVNIIDIAYGDLVEVDGRKYYVADSDASKRTADLIPIEILENYEGDEEKVDSSIKTCHGKEISRIPAVPADEEVVRSIFRLECTPWELLEQGKYPFSQESAKIKISEEDILVFFENLKIIRSEYILDEWKKWFISSEGLAVWSKAEEPGLTLSFLSTVVRDVMAWYDLEEDSDYDALIELRDAYLKSKGKPLSETAVPDVFVDEMLDDIERFARKHPVSDDIRLYYEKVLDGLSDSDSSFDLKRRAYAYYGGNGIVDCDWKKSEDSLLKLFELFGDEYAANSLGYIYASDRLGEPDYKKAFYYFDYAAGYGVTEATYKLSDLYRKGLGTRKDPERALELLLSLYKWCDKRNKAKGKYPDICLRLGYCYRDGVGVEKNLETALAFFKKAEEGIDLRIKKHKTFGDDKVKQNIEIAIKSVLPR